MALANQMDSNQTNLQLVYSRKCIVKWAVLIANLEGERLFSSVDRGVWEALGGGYRGWPRRVYTLDWARAVAGLWRGWNLGSESGRWAGYGGTKKPPAG